MSATSVATTVLKLVWEYEVKPLLNAETQEKLFPVSIDQQILQNVKELVKTTDAIKEEVAKLHIKPAISAFNKEVDYFTTFLLPTLRREFQNGDEKSPQLAKQVEELDKRIKDFSGNISDAWFIVNDRTRDCDFSTRYLFTIAREMCSLHLAMLSINHGLYKVLENKNQVAAYDGYVKAFIVNTYGNCQKCANGLNESRMSKITFKKNIKIEKYYEKGFPHELERARKVKIFYQEAFKSTEPNDKLKGDSFEHSIDKEISTWWLYPTWGEMATAWVDAEKYELDYENHRADVQRNVNADVLDPNYAFVKEWKRVVKENKLGTLPE